MGEPHEVMVVLKCAKELHDALEPFLALDLARPEVSIRAVDGTDALEVCEMDQAHTAMMRMRFDLTKSTRYVDMAPDFRFTVNLSRLLDVLKWFGYSGVALELIDKRLTVYNQNGSRSLSLSGEESRFRRGEYAYAVTLKTCSAEVGRLLSVASLDDTVELEYAYGELHVRTASDTEEADMVYGRSKESAEARTMVSSKLFTSIVRRAQRSDAGLFLSMAEDSPVGLSWRLGRADFEAVIAPRVTPK